MLWLGYLINTDLKTKRADWREYMRICAAVRDARNNMNDKMDNATVKFGCIDNFEDENKVYDALGCVKTYLSPQSMNTTMDDNVANAALRFIPCKADCKDNNEMSAPCNKSECPKHSANAEYFMAQDAFNDALKKRKDYWGKTFARAKQIGWVEYLIHTPVAKMRNDWAAYRAMAAKVREKRAKCRAAYNELAVDLGLQVDSEKMLTKLRETNACIKDFCTPTFSVPNAYELSSDSISYKREYCPSFAVAEYRPCDNINCDMHCQNTKYFHLLDVYVSAREERKKFWGKKFDAHVIATR